MPIVRKVLHIGDSKAVSLPKSWFEFYEKEYACEITEVAIEVNACLKVTPILPKKEVKLEETKTK